MRGLLFITLTMLATNVISQDKEYLIVYDFKVRVISAETNQPITNANIKFGRYNIDHPGDKNGVYNLSVMYPNDFDQSISLDHLSYYASETSLSNLPSKIINDELYFILYAQPRIHYKKESYSMAKKEKNVTDSEYVKYYKKNKDYVVEPGFYVSSLGTYKHLYELKREHTKMESELYHRIYEKNTENFKLRDSINTLNEIIDVLKNGPKVEEDIPYPVEEEPEEIPFPVIYDTEPKETKKIEPLIGEKEFRKQLYDIRLNNEVKFSGHLTMYIKFDTDGKIVSIEAINPHKSFLKYFELIKELYIKTEWIPATQNGIKTEYHLVHDFEFWHHKKLIPAPH